VCGAEDPRIQQRSRPAHEMAKSSLATQVIARHPEAAHQDSGQYEVSQARRQRQRCDSRHQVLGQGAPRQLKRGSRGKGRPSRTSKARACDFALAGACCSTSLDLHAHASTSKLHVTLLHGRLLAWHSMNLFQHALVLRAERDGHEAVCVPHIHQGQLERTQQLHCLHLSRKNIKA
jgi:hypothetical protein